MKNEMTQIFFFRICHYTDDIWLGHWSNGLAISEVNISLLFNIMSIRGGTGTDIEICEVKKNKPTTLVLRALFTKINFLS